MIGINAVTRALEHGQVRLLLVDRDSQPPLLTRHLIGLSALHGCPAIWISKLTKVLGPRLDVTSLVTLAFKVLKTLVVTLTSYLMGESLYILQLSAP